MEFFARGKGGVTTGKSNQSINIVFVYYTLLTLGGSRCSKLPCSFSSLVELTERCSLLVPVYGRPKILSFYDSPGLGSAVTRFISSGDLIDS